MQALYVAIVNSSDNARTLIESDPSQINYKTAKGNDLAKSCMLEASGWLARSKQFALSYDVYNKQLLEPAKHAAEYILQIRNLSPPTEKIAGFVFSRSAPFKDRYSGGDTVTLSIVAPQLAAVMSLRCDASYDEIEYGMFEFEGVQPVPFVNRVHPVRLSITQSKQVMTLAGMDFLKISFQDVASLSSSFAFENYSEIESSQSGRRYIGAAFVLAGRVRSVIGKRVTIQNPCRDDTVDLILSNRLSSSREINDIELLDGRPVRLLCAAWYTLGVTDVLYPEVFYIEPAGDVSNMIVDDISGFARLRGRVTGAMLQSCYPDAEVEKIDVPLAKMAGDQFEWRGYSGDASGSPIARYFLHHRNTIISSRINACSSSDIPAATACPIFEKEKLQARGLANIVNSDERLLQCLLAIIKAKDDYGILPASRDELVNLTIKDTDRQSYAEKIAWLEAVGLIERLPDETRVTDAGQQVAYSATAKVLNVFIQNIIAKRPAVIDLIELENSCGSLPVSLLLKFLKDAERGGSVQRSDIGGHTSSLFWYIAVDGRIQPDPAEAKTRLKRLISAALDSFLLVSYPLTVSKFVELMRSRGYRVSSRIARILLSELEQEKRIVLKGDSWSYPWVDRIRDLLSRNPNTVFSIEDIMRATSIPPVQKSYALEILGNLLQNGDAVEITGGKWTWPNSVEAKTKETVMSILSEFIIETLLRTGGSMDESRLLHMTWHRAHILHVNGIKIDRRQLCDMALDRMIVTGQVKKSGSIYRLQNAG